MGHQQQAMRNVGIFAHVDAGKTTTTEQMLFLSGHIRSLGSVDSGTSQTDWLDVERERGISVRAAVTRIMWNETPVNLVDTPGHVDFLSEVERSLRVMDGAVLIISAVEGVQAQTEVIWQALRELSIPTLIYINKMDRVGADALAVLKQIGRLLSHGVVPVQAPEGAEGDFAGSLDLLAEDGTVQADWISPYRDMMVEAIVEQDEELTFSYLEDGDLPAAKLLPVLEEGIRRSELFPILFGASKRGIGVKELMDAVVRFLPPPEGSEDAPVSGVVFKMEKDPAMGKIAYVRLYDGTIRNRDTLSNFTRDVQDKVTQIRRVHGQKTEDIGLLKAGDIAAVYGLNRARIGDILGSPDRVPGEKRLAVPLLTVQVQWRNEAEYPAIVAAFGEL
ncbi:GTP-binding protein, partial [Paenibacillus sepulcri]|nr:GTP-binding protein [Paenibacillus sepulcri]